MIYGSVVDVLMDWAYGTYPSQTCSPLHGLKGSLRAHRATQHIIALADGVMNEYVVKLQGVVLKNYLMTSDAHHNLTETQKTETVRMYISMLTV